SQIEAERLAKEVTIPQTQPSKSSRLVQMVDLLLVHVVDPPSNAPVRIYSNGLGPGSGIALGAVLSHGDAGGALMRAWGAGFPNNFYTFGSGLWANDAIHRNVTLSLQGSYTNAPQLQYFGPGPDSSESNRTDFRKEDTRLDLRAEVRSNSRLTEACSLRQL